MTEIEVPIEKVQEDLHHHLEHGDHSSSTMKAALLSAILAVFAAISALMAGHYANEAMILQIQSSDQWNYYQAKGIKSSISEIKILSLKNPVEIKKIEEKIDKYKEDQEKIKELADEKQKESKIFLNKHERLATAVTFFQVAIALTAIAVLARRNKFIYVSLLLSIGGLVQFLLGLI
jgi:hypothetical protein